MGVSRRDAKALERDGRRRYVRRFVSAQGASRAFAHCIRSVEARFGIAMRVVITDHYDCILREWQFGKGITFPPGEFPEGASARFTRVVFFSGPLRVGLAPVTAAAPSQDARMTDLSLKKSGRRRDDAMMSSLTARSSAASCCSRPIRPSYHGCGP